MRFALFASALACSLPFSWAASAFEIEERRLYEAAQSQEVLHIISTADIPVFEPLILDFQVRNPTIDVDYVVASSTELMKAIYTENAAFDLAISSAMDLQTKLANDGFAQTFNSSATDGLPDWAQWHQQIFAFTQEPAVLVVSNAAFANLTIPNTREELIELLRENAGGFAGRVGTYDVRSSGLGYLFATQDSRNTESFWRLTEVMGRLNTQLYCCSGAMIDDVVTGRLALAYNVLGSYAENRLKTEAGITIVALQDFSTVMLRTALIPSQSDNPVAAGRMIDYLVQADTQASLAETTGLSPVRLTELDKTKALRRIRLGPGLLVFLDRLKREAFLRNWENSITQK